MEKKRKLLSVCLQGTAGDPRDDLHHDGSVRLHDSHPRPDPYASALRCLPGLNLIKLFFSRLLITRPKVFVPGNHLLV